MGQNIYSPSVPSSSPPRNSGFDCSSASGRRSSKLQQAPNNNTRGRSTSAVPVLATKEEREAHSRVRDKLLNAIREFTPIVEEPKRRSSATSATPQYNATANRIAMIRANQNLVAHEDRDKLLNLFATQLSNKDSMLQSFLGPDWMSTVSIIEKMMDASMFSQYMEMAMQEIDENIDLTSTASEELFSGGKKNGFFDSVLNSKSEHAKDRTKNGAARNEVASVATQQSQEQKQVDVRLMIVPPLTYSSLIEACFPVIEHFPTNPLEVESDKFGLALVVDSWFLYFEPETSLIVPKKLFSAAKAFVEQIPVLLQVTQKCRQVDGLLASCVCKWNSTMYFRNTKLVDSMSPLSFMPGATEEETSMTEKYYGNSLDFVEDFFSNYLKFDFLSLPTMQFIKTLLTNIKQYGNSELIFDMNQAFIEKYGDELSVFLQRHTGRQPNRCTTLRFLDCEDLENFFEKMSLLTEEKESIQCAAVNHVVALRILNCAFSMQNMEESQVM